MKRFIEKPVKVCFLQRKQSPESTPVIAVLTERCLISTTRCPKPNTPRWQ